MKNLDATENGSVDTQEGERRCRCIKNKILEMYLSLNSLKIDIFTCMLNVRSGHSFAARHQLDLLQVHMNYNLIFSPLHCGERSVINSVISD